MNFAGPRIPNPPDHQQALQLLDHGKTGEEEVGDIAIYMHSKIKKQ